MPITLSVPEMTCEGCEEIIETAANEVSGVKSATADRHEGTVAIAGDPNVSNVIQAMDFAGYDAELVEPEGDSEDEDPDVESSNEVDSEVDSTDGEGQEGSEEDGDSDLSGDDDESAEATEAVDDDPDVESGSADSADEDEE